jgi:hypothetical protein
VPIKPAKKELGFSPCGTPTAPWSDVALDRVGRTLLSDAFDLDVALAFDLDSDPAANNAGNNAGTDGAFPILSVYAIMRGE